MSTIDRLFDAKRRAPAVELAPTATPPPPAPEALAATTPPEPPSAPRKAVDQRRDDSATVEVIGSFAAPAQLTDDEPIDVFGGLVGSAPVSGTPSPPAAAVVPVPLPMPASATPPAFLVANSTVTAPVIAPVATAIAPPVAMQAAATPLRRPRSRWAEIASHAMAAVLVVCTGLVIAHRLGVAVPGLARAGAPQAAAPAPAPAPAELPAPSAAAAMEPAPATPTPAADPPPVAFDLPASAPAPSESAPTSARHPPSRPAVAPVVAPADPGATTQATGTVLLAISPWGEVLVDGIGRGVTPPLDRIALAPGSYRFEVRNPAAPRYAATLEVRAGESVTLQHRF
jgi:hypothetical protein